jgi:flagellar L-ring protein precursor FlgH
MNRNTSEHLSEKRLTHRPGRVLHLILLAALVVLSAPRPAVAQSLWDDRGALFTDFRAAGVGDLLTIIIVESASGEHSSELRTEKTSEFDSRFGPGLGALDFIDLFQVGAKHESKHDADGEAIQSGRVRAKITARVAGVRANGDLEIEGTRFVTVNGEKQEIRLVGVVRPRDITHDNTVLSTFVGEAQVEYLGEGTVTESVKVGFWKRLVDWIL